MRHLSRVPGAAVAGRLSCFQRSPKGRLRASFREGRTIAFGRRRQAPRMRLVMARGSIRSGWRRGSRRWGLAAFLLVLGLPAAAQGPELVKDIATGLPYWSGSYASLPVFFHGRGYFGADDGFLGYELWSTDGTQGGTRLIADLCPGRCSGNPQVFTVAGDLLYFVAGNTTGGFDSFW